MEGKRDEEAKVQEMIETLFYELGKMFMNK